jgi:hypothetical protein
VQPKDIAKGCVAVIIFSPALRVLCTPAFATYFPICSLTIFRADTLAAGAFIAVSERENAEWIFQNQRLAVWTMAAMLGLLGLLSMLPGFRTGANSMLFNSIGYSLSAGLFGAIFNSCPWDTARVLLQLSDDAPTAISGGDQLHLLPLLCSRPS